ncbi:MAG: sulfatase-like hydrolase/transferase [Planctomycetota bacterium]
MRPRLLPLPFLAFFIAASMETVRAEESSKKPNVIVIFTDDHGWPDLGVSGIYRDLRTPHLDQLAKDGVYATNGYASAPQCVPSRAGILTGKYQNRFGVESNGVALTGFNAEKTVAERLKLAGYATGQIGKWHLGPASKIVDHGFDDVYSKNSNRPCHANFTLDGKTISMQVVKDGLYHLDACSQAARAFIQRHQKESFFLYLAYRAPHVPLDAPKKYLDRFPGKMPERRRQALAMISAMDDGVGLIRSTLKQCGLTDDTLIFVIGDNGAPLKIHKHDAPGGGPGWDGSLNRPMNGEKGMLSEGGIRVPYVVAWPGTFPAGQIYQHPVISLDVAATALAIAGGEGDSKLDGVNLLPFLSGKRKDPPHASLYWRWIAQSAVREGKWKFLKGGTREYLFDLAKDQGEKVNLAATHADVANRLRSKLRTWAADLKPAGLTTRKMSSVWEQYFDFYLDGKPAPPLRKKSRRGPKAERVKGWVARNAKLSSRGKALRVTTNAKQRNPFL